ncbi:MAG TPA: two-component regulator propeller domain-containing protein [Chryseolinea sp.]
MLDMIPWLRAVVTLLFTATLLTDHHYGWCQLPVITFEVIGTKEGLPSNTVLSATQDHSGFMWFGTRQCPVRYDGTEFKAFTTFTTNFITGIQVDKNNDIWASSDRSGIVKIDSRTLEMSAVVNDKLGSAKTTGDLYIDHSGQGWYSDHHGVNRIDLQTRKTRHYPLRQTTFIWLKAAFIEDTQHNVWVIGRDNGLFLYDRQRDTLECVLGTDSKKPNQFNQLLMSRATVDEDGILWIGTFNYGLLKFDPRSRALEIFETGRTENQISAIEEGWDENGKRILWVGDKHGLGIFRPDQNKFYFFPDILSKPYEVNNIFRNDDGIVWVCTSDGVIKYHPLSNVIQSIPVPPEKLGENVTINVIQQDKRPGYDHIFYLGTSNNVMLRWDRKANDFSSISYPGDAADTRWIEQRPDGTLWIGTNRWDFQRPGIFVYDPGPERFLSPPLSRNVNKYFSVPFFMYGDFVDSTLWIGNSDDGVHALSEKHDREVTPWSAETMKEFLVNNNLINDMIIDRSGRLWIGCYKGVYYFDAGAKRFIKADPEEVPEALDDTAVNSLMEDRHGNVWAARWGSLTRMSEIGKLDKILGTQDGFNDREIKGLVEDHSGNIWIGNHEGLYCYYPDSNRLIRFTTNDGLLSNNTVDRVFISNDKRELLVGQMKGFNLVKIQDVMKTFDEPPLVVNSFKIHQTEYHFDYSDLIRLRPSQNAFSVDFIALNYRKQDDNQYAYYLEGFEEEWNYIGSKHVAYYTNLNPGQYTLHMKAGDAFGNWNDKTLQMNIELLPTFFQTAWFKILVAIVVAGILYGFYRYRINQLLHLQQVRNRISADLHDELGSTLSGISIMGSLAKKGAADQHVSGALVDRIMEDVRQISGSLDDIVWNISPKNDSLSSVIARMTRYASELFEAKQIVFEFDIPERLGDVRLSMEQRRNVYLIFKEAVNNLAKYSKCSHAFVSIRFEKRNVSLVVRDDGVGFDPNAPTDRNGLRNLRQRARSLNGWIDIRSAFGKGTSISLEFPLTK